jgi:hypothetical protein
VTDTTSRKRVDLVGFHSTGFDSKPIINRAHAQVLSDCGYSITEDELLARFFGMSDAEMLIEHKRGCALPAFYAERVAAMIESEFDTLTNPHKYVQG